MHQSTCTAFRLDHLNLCATANAPASHGDGIQTGAFNHRREDIANLSKED